MAKPITIKVLQDLKESGTRFAMATAYDYPTARLVDAAGIEVILVGDSVGNVVLGYESTLPVTMDEMIHHTRAASRGVEKALLVADLPFGAYHGRVEDAVAQGARFLKEAGAHAVKLEGGRDFTNVIKGLVRAGIPVMGHLGLTPQRVQMLSGYRVQGRDAKGAREILEDALALQEAGCFSLVLECVPAEVARKVTESVRIPVIGIGAGAFVDGQVLVFHDLLGLYQGTTPRFVKEFTELGKMAVKGLQQFRSEVMEGQFPGDEHTWTMAPEELAAFAPDLIPSPKPVKRPESTESISPIPVNPPEV